MAIIKLITAAVILCTCTTGISSDSNANENSTDQIINDHSLGGRALFSPRVEYNEWLPVGRGDPLKNDPTYDYSPPVLDRVQYWAAESNGHGSQEQSVQKTDILLLGVTSKKPSSKKEHPHKYQPIRRNFYSSLPTHLMPPPMQQPYHPSSQMMMMNTGWPVIGSQSHKGSVSDDLSSNYVSIGRPNANLIQGEQSSNYEVINQYGQFGRLGNDKDNKKPFLHHLLQKEVTPLKPRPFALPSTVPTPSPVTMSNSNYYSTDSYVIMPSIELPTMSSPVYYQTTTQPPPTYFLPTLPPVTMPPPTIATPLRTVDQLLNYRDDNSNSAHMYHVIIEGHSNVKTYGLHNPNETAQIRHEPKIVTVGSTEDPVIRHIVSKDDQGHNMEVKHLHTRRTNSNMEQTVKNLKEKENSAMHSLMSLLDSSLGSYMEAERRNDDEKNSIQININSSMMTSGGNGGGEVRPRQRTRSS